MICAGRCPEKIQLAVMNGCFRTPAVLAKRQILNTVFPSVNWVTASYAGVTGRVMLRISVPPHEGVIIDAKPGWQVQPHCLVNSNPIFAESLKYLAKPNIRGGVRAAENRHVGVRCQPMHECCSPDQVQNQGQQYSRCRELSQITLSVG